MTILKKLLTFFIRVANTFSLTAQLSLAVSDVAGEQGDVVEVGISISGFEEITSMQFSVNWDSTILDFRNIDNLTDMLNGFTEEEIGTLNAPAGAIRVIWFDSSVQGVSLPDDTQLFTLQFEIIRSGENSSISISNSPIVIEFSTADGSMVELAEVTGGMVNLSDNTTSLSYVIAPNGMSLHQNEPNPFSNTTNIKAIFPTVEDITFFVSDISGKVVYQNTFTSVQGENTISISRDILPVPGTYYYTVQSDRYQLSRKMILLPY